VLSPDPWRYFKLWAKACNCSFILRESRPREHVCNVQRHQLPRTCTSFSMAQKVLLLAACGLWLASQCVADGLPIQLHVRSEITSRLANIHIHHSRRIHGPLTVTYGTCTAESRQDSHHVITEAASTTAESRLVWVIPQNAPAQGCISAWDKDGALVGRSTTQNLDGVVRSLREKRKASESDAERAVYKNID
jgi:hypothetical protein